MVNKQSIKYIILIVIIALFAYVGWTIKANSQVVDVGDEAFNFTHEQLEGDEVSLADFKGKVVVLNFFTTWCSPCQEEAADLEAFEKQYGDQVKMLILDRGETKERVKKFKDKYKTTSTYLFDYNMKTSKKYNVVAQPETFIIDQKGVIKEHYIGAISTNELTELVEKYQKLN